MGGKREETEIRENDGEREREMGGRKEGGNSREEGRGEGDREHDRRATPLRDYYGGP